MTKFNEYWKEKAQKRRKSWEGKLNRRIANHTPIEEIRKDVFKPFCQTPNFDGFCELAESHYTTKNPLAEWRGGKFCFSEVGLRDALLQYGGKLNEFTATREHSVCERRHFTDLDTFTFTYGEATMIIKRYAAKDVPFGRYEISARRNALLSRQHHEHESGGSRPSHSPCRSQQWRTAPLCPSPSVYESGC